MSGDEEDRRKIMSLELVEDGGPDCSEFVPRLFSDTNEQVATFLAVLLLKLMDFDLLYENAFQIPLQTEVDGADLKQKAGDLELQFCWL